jgi:hypothetical protein
VAEPGSSDPQRLADRVGRGRLVPAGAVLVANAVAAVEELSPNFQRWIAEEVERLETAEAELLRSGMTGRVLRQLADCALDLKGLAPTYGYPLIRRLGWSLFRLLDQFGGDPPAELIHEHIDAIRTIVRDEIRDVNDPIGEEVVEQLQLRVWNWLARR